MKNCLIILTILFALNAHADTTIYTPAEAIADANADPLVFMGKGLLYGSISIESCVFKNSRAYVIHRYCTKPEVGAGDMTVYSFARKQMIKIHAESSRNQTPISETDPKDYTPEYWYVDFSILPQDFSSTMTFTQFLAFFEKHNKTYPPTCFVSSRFSQCEQGLKDYESWLPIAGEFRQNPPRQWVETLSLLKSLAR